MRRRFVWIQGRGWAAALIYTVVVGESLQVWLQDDGGTPALLYTLPRRFSLGWSGTNSGDEPVSIGYLTRPIPGIGLDIPRPYIEGFPSFGNNNPSIGYSVSGGGFRLNPGPSGSPIVQTESVPPPFSGNGFYFTGTGLGYTQMMLVHFSGEPPVSITIPDASNFANIYLQRRPEGTFVYTQHTPYNSTTTPPDMVNGIWQESLHWASPGAGTDISESVVGLRSPFLTISSPDPWLNGQALNPNRNILAGASYAWNAFEPMVSGGALVEGQVNIATAEGGLSSETIQIKGAPSEADQVLSVAVYPR
jgi:hypothetical protein